MSSLLERRYRAALRLLPSSYRAEREDEMVAEFMEMSGDVPDEVNPRPRWGELASVLALAVQVRLGGTRAAPRAFAWGEAVRLIALLGLAYQSVYAFFVAEVLLGGLISGDVPHFLDAAGPAERLLYTAESLAVLCSAVAFVAIMRGHARPAKAFAGIGMTLELAGFLTPAVGRLVVGMNPGADAADTLLAVVPAVALLLGFHSDVEPRRRSWGLAMAPLIAGLTMKGLLEAVIVLGLQERNWIYLWLDLVGTAVLALAAGSAFALARGRSPSWTLALAGAALLLLVVRLPLLLALYVSAWNTVAWSTVCAQCLVLSVLLGVLTATGLRALPPAAPAAARS